MTRHSGEIDVRITRIYARSKHLVHGVYQLCLNSSTACLITIAACFDLCFPSSLLLTDFATYLLFFYSSNFFAVMYTCMTVLCHLQLARTRRDFWIPGHGSPPNLIGVMGIEHPLLPKQACFTTDSDDPAWQLPKPNFLQSPTGFP